MNKYEASLTDFINYVKTDAPSDEWVKATPNAQNELYDAILTDRKNSSLSELLKNSRTNKEKDAEENQKLYVIVENNAEKKASITSSDIKRIGQIEEWKNKLTQIDMNTVKDLKAIDEIPVYLKRNGDTNDIHATLGLLFQFF